VARVRCALRALQLRPGGCCCCTVSAWDAWLVRRRRADMLARDLLRQTAWRLRVCAFPLPAQDGNRSLCSSGATTFTISGSCIKTRDRKTANAGRRRRKTDARCGFNGGWMSDGRPA